MRKLAIAALLAVLPSIASAQTFPTIPAGTVVGRTAIGPGPAQAIPLATLFSSVPQGISATKLTLTQTGTGYALGTNQTVTGTPDPGIFFRNIIGLSDSADHSAQAFGSVGFYVQHRITGGQGGRAAGFFNMSATNSPSASSSNNDLTALVGLSSTGVSLGGTIGTPFGNLFGGNFAVSTTAAVDYLAGVTGAEIDTNIAVGSTLSAKVALHIAQVATDKVSGSIIDAGIRFANQTGAVNWNDGILFDNIVQEPVKTTGTLFRTEGSWTIANGIDISSVTISGNAFASNGFSVSGAGALTAGAISASTLTASDNLTFTAATKTVVLKRGANGTVGTFVCTSGGSITVNNTNVAITDTIIISLNTVGGTVSTPPGLNAITAATSFVAKCATSDTSTYNYAIIKNAA